MEGLPPEQLEIRSNSLHEDLQEITLIIKYFFDTNFNQTEFIRKKMPSFNVIQNVKFLRKCYMKSFKF